ncbi:MAG: tetratricopeptide repeat protein [Thermoguttaceae bacterium]
MKRIALLALVGLGLWIVACALVVGVVFSRWVKPGGPTVHSKQDAAASDEEQLEEATRAIAANPMDAEAHCQLGVTLANLHRPDEAMAQFQAALRIKPDYAEAHYQLGVALASRHQLDQAIAHFRKALQINPDYAEARQQLEQAMKAKR